MLITPLESELTLLATPSPLYSRYKCTGALAITYEISSKLDHQRSRKALDLSKLDRVLQLLDANSMTQNWLVWSSIEVQWVSARHIFIEIGISIRKSLSKVKSAMNHKSIYNLRIRLIESLESYSSLYLSILLYAENFDTVMLRIAVRSG